MDSLLDREITTLQSERKMGETEIKSQQSQMAMMLHGSMGRDMLDVLEGRKKVRLSRWIRFKYWFKNILRRLNGTETDII